jgi:hypothetical protein
MQGFTAHAERFCSLSLINLKLLQKGAYRSSRQRVLVLIDSCLNAPRRIGRDSVLAALVAAEDEKPRNGHGVAFGEVEAVVLNDLLVVALAAGEASFGMIAHGRNRGGLSRKWWISCAVFLHLQPNPAQVHLDSIVL